MSDIPESAVQVPLYRRDGSVRCYTIIDAEDEAWVRQWQWFGLLANRGHRYAARRGPKLRGKYTTILLHRELLGLPRYWDGLDGDHRNHDRLDNRRSNLRALDHGENVRAGPHIKLNDRLVLAARLRYVKGEAPIAQMARECGVSGTTLAAAIYGETWAHLPMPIRCTHGPLQLPLPLDASA